MKKPIYQKTYSDPTTLLYYRYAAFAMGQYTDCCSDLVVDDILNVLTSLTNPTNLRNVRYLYCYTYTTPIMMKTVYPFNYLTMCRATLPHRSLPFGADDDWLWSCLFSSSSLVLDLLESSCWLPLFSIFMFRLEAWNGEPTHVNE